MRQPLLIILLFALASLARAVPQEVQAPCSDGQAPICYGEHAKCSLSTGNEIDVYYFVGQFRDQVRLVLRGTSNNLDPNVEIYRPDGTFHSSKFCSAGSTSKCSMSTSFDLDQDGLWTLVVTDAGSDNAGGYVLSLEQIVPTHPIPTLDYGQTVNISLGHEGDEDWFRVESLANTNIRFSAQGLTNNLDPRLQVFDANGTFITEAMCSAGSTSKCSFNLSMNPAPDGPLYICMFDWGWDNNGSVSLTLQCLVGNCPPPNPPTSLGTNYCATNSNSTGVAATMAAFGSPFVVDNQVHLELAEAPPGEFGIFFLGQGTTSQALPAPSQGILCVSGLTRLPLAMTCNAGKMHYDLDLMALPQGVVIQPGQTWHFQGWFRDMNPNATSNTSDGLSILFQ